MTGADFLHLVAGKNGERLIEGMAPKLLATETRNLFNQGQVTLYLVRFPIRMPPDWNAENPDYWLLDVSGLDLE